ncbi:hypothetical protein BpHYR1_035060 [Brachionus plicatilis]|uniref:Uncharacterized protein n=1 Tax=Brachionus plicatilis TaxID=10195 RepID=A0A3M7SZP3_BRAPC|nr:hypothetical protein BpHYR1_035060 [Brachionus plicatilis]
MFTINICAFIDKSVLVLLFVAQRNELLIKEKSHFLFDEINIYAKIYQIKGNNCGFKVQHNIRIWIIKNEEYSNMFIFWETNLSMEIGWKTLKNK